MKSHEKSKIIILGEIIKEIMRFLNPSGTVHIITEWDILTKKFSERGTQWLNPMVKGHSDTLVWGEIFG